MSRPKIAERVERMLVIVPYVVAHPGTRLEELGELFDVQVETLTQDLGTVLMSGVPPYGPGDLLEVTIEDERVWIGLAKPLTRPVRLTPDEALALYLRGTEILGSPGLEEGAPLAAALDKLRDGLEDLPGDLPVEPGEGRPSGPLAAIRLAASRHERIEVEHYSKARDEVRTRRIDPEEVFSQLGSWYVAAWDHRTDEERLFRVDRIRAVRPTGETFEPRGLEGLGRPLYSPGEGDTVVRLRLSPAARWVTDYYHVDEAVASADGTVDVSFPAADLRWVVKLLLRLGPDAEVLDPPELSEAITREARETLARYA